MARLYYLEVQPCTKSENPTLPEWGISALCKASGSRLRSSHEDRQTTVRRLEHLSFNSQRNLAQMVFSKRLVRLAGFFHRKSSGHMHFKWTRIEQSVQSVDECRADLSIVGLNLDTCRTSRFRHHAIWIRDPSPVANH